MSQKIILLKLYFFEFFLFVDYYGGHPQKTNLWAVGDFAPQTPCFKSLGALPQKIIFLKLYFFGDFFLICKLSGDFSQKKQICGLLGGFAPQTPCFKSKGQGALPPEPPLGAPPPDPRRGEESPRTPHDCSHRGNNFDRSAVPP